MAAYMPGLPGASNLYAMQLAEAQMLQAAQAAQISSAQKLYAAQVASIEEQQKQVRIVSETSGSVFRATLGLSLIHRLFIYFFLQYKPFFWSF